MRAGRVLSVLTIAALACSATATAHADKPAVSSSAARRAAAGDLPDNLTLVRANESLLGTHYWYQQTYRNVPVLGTFYARHVDSSGAETVDDGRVRIAPGLSVQPAIARTAARSQGVSAVAERLDAEEASQTELAVLPGATSRLVWSVIVDGRDGEFRSLVDAQTGAVVRTDNLVKHADGTGRVFDPNPVVSRQNESLVDDRDADRAVPTAAYSWVALHHLAGSGRLSGSYANIALPVSGQATSSINAFSYSRHDDRFEQVMAYYAVDTAQSYLHRLGFTGVNSESQDLLPDASNEDNSWYSPEADTITFGSGGVDDAEDAEVIWHEYGHAVQDAQVPGFGSTEEGGAIGEGFGDYLAMTMSQSQSPNTAKTPWACVMDWDSTSYTSTTPHCIRRTDTNKTIADKTGEVHDDGEIWSRALFDLNRKLGRNKANKIIVEAQFNFAPDTSFNAAARRTVATARKMYGDATAGVVATAFRNRGMSLGAATCRATNRTDVAIRDHRTATSRIRISHCRGHASARSTVEVHIRHRNVGDLVVVLVAPDGTSYPLQRRLGGHRNRIDRTYRVDLSREWRIGVWKLRVTDVARRHHGRIDSWTLTLS